MLQIYTEYHIGINVKRFAIYRDLERIRRSHLCLNFSVLFTCAMYSFFLSYRCFSNLKVCLGDFWIQYILEPHQVENW